MRKYFLKVSMLLLVIVGIVFGIFHYQSYVVTPLNQMSWLTGWQDVQDLNFIYDKETTPMDQYPLVMNNVAFPKLYKAVMDKQGDIYAIDDSKATIVKYDADGMLQYKLNDMSRNTDRQYNEFADLAVDAQGNLYALEYMMDTNGMLINQEQVVRFAPDGTKDKSWTGWSCDYTATSGNTQNTNGNVNTCHLSNKVEPQRQGEVHSLQMTDAGLYFFTVENSVLSLHQYSFNQKSGSIAAQGQVIFQKQLPPTLYLSEIVGTNQNAIYYTTQQGRLYKMGMGQLYPQPGQTGKLFPIRIQLDAAAQNLYFIDEYGTSVKKIALSNPQQVERQITNDVILQKLQQENLGGEMNSLTMGPDGTLVIGINDRVVRFTTQNQLEPLTYATAMHQIQWAYEIGLVVAVLCFLWALKIMLVNILPKSLFWKQLLIPVLLILTALMTSTLLLIVHDSTTEIKQEVERGMIFLAHDGQNLLDGNELEKITSPADYMDADYQALYNKLTFVDNFGKFYSTLYKLSPDQKQYESIIDDNYKMFESDTIDQLDDGMVCQRRDNTTGDWENVSDLTRIVNNHEVLSCSSSDAEGKWLFAMGPVYAADKSTVIGIYETGINRHAFDSRILAIVNTAWDTIGYTLLGLVVLMLLITLFLYLPIDRLSQGASEIAAGQYDVKLRIRSKDEVGKLANNFNVMASKISQSIEEVQTFSDSYQRFVPENLIQLLGKDKIVDVQLGDQVQKQMSVLVVNIREFQELSHEMSPEELFRFMNEFLQYVTPAVHTQDGLINKYLGSGVLALFPDEAQQTTQALRAAIIMRDSLEKYNALRVQNGKKPIDIGIGIQQGLMVLGIIGDGNRLEGTVLSDDVTFANDLEELSETLGATVLIPAALMSQLDGREQVEYRHLGLLQLSREKAPVELCDVFSADREESRQLKAQSKELFESAILFYQQGRFYDARETFLQVININQDDKIAKLYFYKCDELFRTGASSDWSGALDVP